VETLPYFILGIRSLADVDGSSPSDLWAVGGYGVNSRGAVSLQPLVEHWDGQRWTEVVVPARDYSRTGLLTVVTPSPGETWAAGAGELLHRVGSRWTALPLPAASGEEPALRAAAASSPSDVWFVGDTRMYSSPSAGQAYVLHWDGQRLSRIATTGLSPGLAELASVTATPGGAVFVGGDTGSAGPAARIARRTATGWSLLPAPPAAVPSILDLSASSVDLWAVGQQRADVWRYASGRWSSQRPDPRPGALVQAVDGHDPSRVWVAGRAGRAPGDTPDDQLLARRDAAGWSVRFSYPRDPNVWGVLVAVRAISGRVVAVGGGEKTLAVQN
jgi:hypothetical protein